MTPVLFVIMDGLRPDALTQARLPTLEGLRARGASTLRAASLMPSITLPCHMSLFHSVPAARHGVTGNTWAPMARPLPGLVDLAHAAGRRAAFFHNWEPLRNLNQPGTLYYSYFRDCSWDADGDDRTVVEVTRFLSGGRAEFVFVYFGTVDTAGHGYGWMSPQYLAQAERVDSALGRIIAALPPDFSVIVQADHGGHGRSHGTDLPEDMLIPWIAAGPGIRAGHAIRSNVTLLDTAPTITRLLGLVPHPEWEGRAVEEIFQ